MTLDSHNIERLRQLGRQLPKPLHLDLNKENINDKKLHPIETETDPDILFDELMKASPDGNIPDHLIARLKEIEKRLNPNINEEPREFKSRGSYKERLISKNDDEFLYASFNRLLLEEDD